jgi:hypothetical protein
VQTKHFDLTTILGCSVRDARVRQLLEFFEEVPQQHAERYPGGDYYLEFPQTGFSLLINASDVITTIHVYTQPNGAYAAYRYELPLGAVAHMSQVEARALLCPPSKFGGPVQFMQSMPVTYWDIWEFGDHSVHIEYPEDRLSIRLVTLSVVPQDSTNAA